MEVTHQVIANFNSKQNHSPYSLGIQSIGAYCLARGAKVNLVSCSQDPSKNSFNLLRNGPSLIGFSVNSSSEIIAKETIAEIKKRTTIPVVIGGPSITYSCENSSILDCNADIFVKGEGEVPFYELISGGLEDIMTGRKKIKGVYRKGEFGTERAITDLSHVPSPHPISFNASHVYWETSRGCSFNCIYCAHPGGNDFFRRVPIERLTREVAIFKEMPNLKAIYVTDPVLGGTQENTKRVLQLLERLNDKFITASLRPEYLDSSVLKLLKRVGIGWLDIGVQTTNPNLSYFRKNSKEGLDNLSKLREMGISYNLDLIYGIPRDSPSGFYQSLKDAIEIFRPSSLKIFRLKVYEGTTLHALAKESRWKYDLDTRKIKSVEGFSQQEIESLGILSQNTANLYNYLERNNWFEEEQRLRKIHVFSDFSNFLVDNALEFDKLDRLNIRRILNEKAN